MVLGDLISNILDSYLPIRIEIWNHNNGVLVKKKNYRFKPHATDYSDIPNEIWNMYVTDICIYCDAFVIGIQEDEQ